MSRRALIIAAVSALSVIALAGCSGAPSDHSSATESTAAVATEQTEQTEAPDEGSRKPGPVEHPYTAPECKAVSAAALQLINDSLTDAAGRPMVIQRPIASWSETDKAWVVSGPVSPYPATDQPIVIFATKAYLPADDVPDVTSDRFGGELFAIDGSATQYSSLPARIGALSENGLRGVLNCSAAQH